jgi:hypothetical protein
MLTAVSFRGAYNSSISTGAAVVVRTEIRTKYYYLNTLYMAYNMMHDIYSDIVIAFS